MFINTIIVKMIIIVEVTMKRRMKRLAYFIVLFVVTIVFLITANFNLSGSHLDGYAWIDSYGWPHCWEGGNECDSGRYPSKI